KSLVGSLETRTSIIYSSDLFLPYDDPDDHIDLVTLLSLPQLDVRAIVLDHTMKETVERTGVPRVINFQAAQKAMKLFKREGIPVVSGCRTRLTDSMDDISNRAEEDQAGVNLILKTLQSVRDKEATLISTGSVRDFTAAYNRDPDLFHSKVKRLLISIGDSYGATGTDDYNTFKDVEAWKGLITSGLPIDWLPTNPSKVRGAPSRYVSYWYCLQSELLGESAEPLKEFFASENIIPESRRTRPMWSSVAFIEAAGLQCYDANGEVKWMSANKADQLGFSRLAPYSFLPITLTLDTAGVAQWKIAESTEKTQLRIFRINDYYQYNETMLKFINDQFKTIEN
ncbi:MAG: nucleoside hydrolase, partial [Bacteroidota bacterium]